MDLCCPHWLTDFSRGLRNLQEQGLFCDVVIQTAECETYSAHANVLAAASPILSTYMQDSGLFVKFDEISAQTWQRLLEFMYTGKVFGVPPSDAHLLYEAARKLGIDTLTSLIDSQPDIKPHLASTEQGPPTEFVKDEDDDDDDDDESEGAMEDEDNDAETSTSGNPHGDIENEEQSAESETILYDTIAGKSEPPAEVSALHMISEPGSMGPETIVVGKTRKKQQSAKRSKEKATDEKVSQSDLKFATYEVTRSGRKRRVLSLDDMYDKLVDVDDNDVVNDEGYGVDKELNEIKSEDDIKSEEEDDDLDHDDEAEESGDAGENMSKKRKKTKEDDESWNEEEVSDQEEPDDEIDAENNRPSRRKSSAKKVREKKKCSICGRGYSNQACLAKHIRKAHTENPDVKVDVKSIKTNKAHQCLICERYYKSARLLRQHTIKQHSSFENLSSLSTSQARDIIGDPNDESRKRTRCHVEPKSCSLCGVECYDVRALKKHLREEHPDVTDVDAIIPSPNDRVICSICGVSVQRYSLWQHEWKKHGVRSRADRSRYLACPHCPVRFTTKLCYDVHLDKHNNTKRYVCDVCGARLANSKSLREHRQIHDNVRNHHCRFCELSFTKDSSKRQHEPLHFPEHRSYVCRWCGEGFVQVNSINLHMAKYHPELPRDQYNAARRYVPFEYKDGMVAKPVTPRMRRRPAHGGGE